VLQEEKKWSPVEFGPGREMVGWNVERNGKLGFFWIWMLIGNSNQRIQKDFKIQNKVKPSKKGFKLWFIDSK
jgi:hypothetical protein